MQPEVIKETLNPERTSPARDGPEKDARWGFWLQSLFGNGNQAEKKVAEENRKKLPYQLHHHSGRKNDPTQTQDPHSSPSLSQNPFPGSYHPTQDPYGNGNDRGHENGDNSFPAYPQSKKNRYYSRQMSLSSDRTCETADDIDFVYTLSNMQDINFATSAISNSIDDYGAVEFGIEEYTNAGGEDVRVVEVCNSTDKILRIVIHFKYLEDWITSDWVQVFPNCKEILCTTDCNFVYVHAETDKEVWEDDDYVFKVDGQKVNFFRHNFNTQETENTYTIEFNPGSGVPCYQAYRIWLVNDTLSVLKIAISYRELACDEGDWKDMCWLFDPGEEGILVDTQHPVLFLFAETDAHVWQGEIPMMHDIVGEKNFYRHDLQADGYCRVQLKLDPDLKKLKPHKTDIDFGDDYSVASFASNQYKTSSVYSFGGNSICTGFTESYGGSSVFEGEDHELSDFFNIHDRKEPMVVAPLFEIDNHDEDDEECKIVQSDGHSPRYNDPTHHQMPTERLFNNTLENHNQLHQNHQQRTKQYQHHNQIESEPQLYHKKSHSRLNTNTNKTMTTRKDNNESLNASLGHHHIFEHQELREQQKEMKNNNINIIFGNNHDENSTSSTIEKERKRNTTTSYKKYPYARTAADPPPSPDGYISNKKQKRPQSVRDSPHNLKDTRRETSMSLPSSLSENYSFQNENILESSETNSIISNLSKESYKKQPYKQNSTDSNFDDGYGPVLFLDQLQTPNTPPGKEIIFHGKNNTTSVPVKLLDFTRQETGYTTVTAVDGTKICTVYE